MSAPLLHPDGLRRCPWPKDDPLYVAYHDEEWGVPEFDDRALYEKLVLDGFQAGLSWITILRKRDNFRRAFDGFDPAEDRALSSGPGREADAGRRHRAQPAEDRRHPAVGACLARRDGEGPGLLGAAVGFRRRQAQGEPLPQPQAGPGRNRRYRGGCRRSLQRAASSSSGRPSSMPSCRPSAWSTTTSSTAIAIRRLRAAAQPPDRHRRPCAA